MYGQKYSDQPAHQCSLIRASKAFMYIVNTDSSTILKRPTDCSMSTLVGEPQKQVLS